MKQITEAQRALANKLAMKVACLDFKEHARPRIRAKLQAQILTIVGADGPCHLTNQVLWESYYEWHRDVIGFRPGERQRMLSASECRDQLEAWSADQKQNA